ncbi:hypothetical protein HNQ02_003763 [Flavobacterium sp. 7E]|uniref:hypothetical protein n=1 Tax=Flavobacterium sp. 7E TaxID=2735898 RepID=UPI00156F5C19|nr:hypothetical protein [Flavobacterium sp. 7E]NRS90816.1 hypothetical protein [Flavobacterium sp. 7E]
MNKKVDGKYRSKFADLGFFITEIELKSDSTFHYKSSGDLQHTELEGNYKVLNNILYLRFDKQNGEIEKDVVKIKGNDTIVDFEKLNNSHNYKLKKENEIDYNLKYKISKNKLQVYNIETGKLVRKGKKYTNRRKYILFGPKNYMKKSYLKKITE